MFNDKIKGLLVGLLAGSMLTGGLVFARSGNQWIEASYDNIKLYVNGSKVDTSSNEPFIYNGSTYLPVRAVAEALGQNVDWDGNTKSVYIGLNPNNVTYLMDVCPPYQSNFLEGYLSSSGNYFTMAGTKYSNGFVFNHTWNANALFNLNGKYSRMKLVLGSIYDYGYYLGNDEYIVSFIVDGKTVATYDMNTTMMPKEITVPLNYGSQLKIVTSENKDIKTGFGNIIVE